MKRRLDFLQQLNQEMIDDDEHTLSGSEFKDRDVGNTIQFDVFVVSLNVSMLTFLTTFIAKESIPWVNEELQAEVIHASEPSEEDVTPVSKPTEHEKYIEFCL
ncbi:hypothetical protein CDL15_Pgr018910 [Punica granatum]|uniref:Uncharacterized protein n=1 Tax=Punica granatum TaxID=22663 RepID=A0A218WNB8_PUNGR|nr:hypothetical protein CDL15_Pgr018910 [Punica granatum]